MKMLIDYFRAAQRFGGTFHEDWNQHRAQMERIVGYYDLTDRDLLDFVTLSLRAGAQSF